MAKKQTLTMRTVDTYEDLVKKTTTVFVTFTRRMLDTYWQVGAMVNKLTGDPDNYGNRTIAQFAQEVEHRLGHAVGESTYRKAAKFQAAFTKSQVKLLQEKGIPWSVACTLSTDSLGGERRDELLTKLASGAESASSIPDTLAALPSTTQSRGSGSNKQTTGTKGRTTNLKMLRGLTGVVNIFTRKLTDVEQSAVEIFKGSDVTEMREAKQAIDEFTEVFYALAQDIQQQLTAVQVEVEKVRSVLNGEG